MFQKILITTFLLLITSFTTACFKKKRVCPKVAGLENIKGLRANVLERPKDKTKVMLGEFEYFLTVNEKSEVYIEGEGEKQLLIDLNLTLKNGDKKQAYFAEIDWAGDNNKDCYPDFIIWKKLGIYIGKFEVKSETHDEAPNEKLYIESQKDKKKPYKVQSLGKY